MGTIKSNIKSDKYRPSTFALLVDDINKMTESEQKVLWLRINKEKISPFAKELDAAVVPNNVSVDEIGNLISEVRKNGKHKKS